MSAQEGSPRFVVPDSIEPVVGWKGWRPLNDFLNSPTVGGEWPYKMALEARCNGAGIGYIRFPHHGGSPGDRCSCGIHLAQTPLAALAYGSIIGRVYGWGKTIVHEQGWRVQYAYPMEIYSIFSEDACFDAYGVPVHRISVEQLGLMAELSAEGLTIEDITLHAKWHRMFSSLRSVRP